MDRKQGSTRREDLLEMFGPALADYTPVIEDLEVTDVTITGTGGAVLAATHHITAEFDFTDLDGDIKRVKGQTEQSLDVVIAVGMYAAFVTPAKTFTHPASYWDIDGLASGHAHRTFSVPSDHDLLSVYVTDWNGNRSNELTEPYVRK